MLHSDDKRIFIKIVDPAENKAGPFSDSDLSWTALKPVRMNGLYAGDRFHCFEPDGEYIGTFTATSDSYTSTTLDVGEIQVEDREPDPSMEGPPNIHLTEGYGNYCQVCGKKRMGVLFKKNRCQCD